MIHTGYHDIPHRPHPGFIIETQDNREPASLRGATWLKVIAELSVSREFTFFFFFQVRAHFAPTSNGYHCRFRLQQRSCFRTPVPRFFGTNHVNTIAAGYATTFSHTRRAVLFVVALAIAPRFSIDFCSPSVNLAYANERRVCRNCDVRASRRLSEHLH